MIAWFARNGVAANLLMAVIVFLGLYSLFNLIPLEVFPEFQRDVVNVQMQYRGATPAEVEEGVVIRVEEAIADLQGIKEITSNANEGTARVRIELAKGYDPRDLLEDIKNRVDAISTFPDDTERPTYSVQQFRREVISVAVSGDLAEQELRELGEQVRDDLVALPEITQVELTAVRPYEIAIEVSESDLERYGLTFDELAQAIRRSSVDLPAGSIKTTGGEILLRTKGQAYVKEEFERLVVLTRSDGTRLTVGDVATVRDGFEEEPLYAQFNGRRAVIIEIYRVGEQSAIELAAAVREYVAKAADRLPAGVNIDFWRDRSRIVKARLNTLARSAMQGGLLIFLILTLFLRLSVAVWVCVGIPISFMGALALMPHLDVTINIVSLFAFIVVLGIVVDDAIVTGENIYTHLKRGRDPTLAAIDGTEEVAVPVTFGILTTVVAFVPLLMIGGQRGPIFAQIPLIIIPVLLFSLVESKLILPAHMKHIRMDRDHRKGPGSLWGLQTRVADGLENAVRSYYQPLLQMALRRRYLTLALFVAGSVVILAFVFSGRTGYTFFPRVQSETARATLQMNVGTPVEVTTQNIDRMTQAARRLQAKYRDAGSGQSVIRNILSSVGYASGGFNPSRGGGQSHVGQVSLELDPPEDRLVDITTSALVREWRQEIGTIAGAKELTFRAEIGRGGDPIDVQLTGSDFEVLAGVAERIKERLREYPGVFDIQDTFDDGKEEIKLTIKPQAELLGLTAEDLGRQVRHAFFGQEAQRIQRGRNDVRVMVRYPAQERRSVNSLQDMRIRTADGTAVPFADVADAKVGQGFAIIRRVDRNRAVNVRADINKEKADANQIAADLRLFVDDLVGEYPGVRYTLEGEQREQRETSGSLMVGALLILFALYCLLAIPFRSYVQPLIVMGIIPFSVVGAILGHMIMGMNLSITSIMGILALAGVVVNDSLVLVDYVNRRRREGSGLFDAVSVAGVARFRPILLTSLTTFFGLSPLILEKSTQAQFLIPMAVSLGFGILFATFITLLLIPVCYLVLEDGVRLFTRRPLATAVSDS